MSKKHTRIRREIFKLLTDFPDIETKTIAQVVGVHPNTVYKYRKMFLEKLETDKERGEIRMKQRIDRYTFNVSYGDRKIHVAKINIDHLSEEINLECIDMETYQNSIFGNNVNQE